MRVSKETAVLLKEARFKWKAYHTNVDGSVSPSYLPTIHEAADWLRSKGVHVVAAPNFDYIPSQWVYEVFSLDGKDWILIDSVSGYATHDSAYEAGIVHGLKYII